VLKDADLIAQARSLAEQCIAQDPELANPGLTDIVLDMEMDAAGDWLERS
jgi:ATP-dependent DNA helicase RecG